MKEYITAIAALGITASLSLAPQLSQAQSFQTQTCKRDLYNLHEDVAVALDTCGGSGYLLVFTTKYDRSRNFHCDFDINHGQLQLHRASKRNVWFSSGELNDSLQEAVNQSGLIPECYKIARKLEKLL